MNGKKAVAVLIPAAGITAAAVAYVLTGSSTYAAMWGAVTAGLISLAADGVVYRYD